MTEEEYFKRSWVKAVVNNPDFLEIVAEMKAELGQLIMISDNKDQREHLYYQAKALDRVIGQFEVIANNVREYEAKMKR